MICIVCGKDFPDDKKQDDHLFPVCFDCIAKRYIDEKGFSDILWKRCGIVLDELSDLIDTHDGLYEPLGSELDY